MLKIFNTLTRKKEVFKPLEGKLVRLYTCGPTVYDFAHIGNLRTYVLQDVLKRYLEYKGYKVRHVMNLTDIDDKTIRRSGEEGSSLKEFTEKYTKEFLKDSDALNIKRATVYVKATDEIEDMIKITTALVEKGFAYVKHGSVYFDISKFKDYGKLSKIDLKSIKVGARVDVDEYAKDSPQDFALFKRSTLQELKRGIFYETPWGKGRPGWHIECSAIAIKHLGETIDIHSGGSDLIFPHHENEIAQSEAYTGKQFSKYWVHCEHLLVNGEKMSKSLGNFFMLRDLLNKGYSAKAIRYLLLSAHYRSQLNFTEEGLRQAEKTVLSMTDFMEKIQEAKNGEYDKALHKKTLETKKKFEKALDNDLNMPEALSAIFSLMHETNRAIERIGEKNVGEIYNLFLEFDKVLGLGLEGAEEKELPPDLAAMIEERERLRSEKKFLEADKIRKELAEKGIILEDSPQGVRWKRKER